MGIFQAVNYLRPGAKARRCILENLGGLEEVIELGDWAYTLADLTQVVETGGGLCDIERL